ncbi:MAG: hypothetical protein H7Y30_07920 [Pyrinomonadaceae bacterium]|nr:hypothetical protein [Pyrinomonadaceae bacterium]
MRVLVIGSNRFDYEFTSTQGDVTQQETPLFEAAAQVGYQLTKNGHTILICSRSQDTVDPYILDGAKKASDKSSVELHVSDNSKLYFKELERAEDTDVVPKIHLSPDTQIVHMEAMADADALIIMGGGTRSTRTGVSAYMLGKTVIPIGSFGGAGKAVWLYASSKREEFYRGGLTDAEIDKLAEPWKGEKSAEEVVESLEKVRKTIIKNAIPRFVLAGAIAILLVAMVGWVSFIAYGYNLTSRGVVPLGLVFISVCFAGLIGSALKNLFDIRNGRMLTARDLNLDVALGLGAGFVASVLYLVVQVAVTGRAESIETKDDYVRIALLVSLIAIFAAMYLDTAFANFETVKGSVLSGELGKRQK